MYDIRTDAELRTDIDATDIDDAVRQFVDGNSMFRGVANLETFRKRIIEIGDGAWAWINCDDERVVTIGEVC